MDIDTNSTDTILWRVFIAKPTAQVFAYLTHDALRQQYWCELSVQDGPNIAMHFSNRQKTMAQVQGVAAPKVFDLRYFDSDVSFRLEATAVGTILTVENTGVAVDEWQAVQSGWVSVLLALKAACQFGIDLRNHDPARSWDQGFVDN